MEKKIQFIENAEPYAPLSTPLASVSTTNLLIELKNWYDIDIFLIKRATKKSKYEQ